MKRRHRLFHSIAMKFMRRHAYGGYVLPPGSMLIANEEVASEYGHEPLKVGYYSKIFGLREVFLLDSEGKEKVWLSQKDISKRFTVTQLSDEQDHFQDQVSPSERYWKGPGHRAYLG